LWGVGLPMVASRLGAPVAGVRSLQALLCRSASQPSARTPTQRRNYRRRLRASTCADRGTASGGTYRTPAASGSTSPTAPTSYCPLAAPANGSTSLASPVVPTSAPTASGSASPSTPELPSTSTPKASGSTSPATPSSAPTSAACSTSTCASCGLPPSRGVHVPSSTSGGAPASLATPLVMPPREAKRDLIEVHVSRVFCTN